MVERRKSPDANFSPPRHLKTRRTYPSFAQDVGLRSEGVSIGQAERCRDAEHRGESSVAHFVPRHPQNLVLGKTPLDKTSDSANVPYATASQSRRAQRPLRR